MALARQYRLTFWIIFDPGLPVAYYEADVRRRRGPATLRHSIVRFQSPKAAIRRLHNFSWYGGR